MFKLSSSGIINIVMFSGDILKQSKQLNKKSCFTTNETGLSIVI